VKVFDVVHKALGVLLVGFTLVVVALAILHKERGRRYWDEAARLDVLDRLVADGFSEVEILAQKQFTEVRTCYDFKVSMIGSGGQLVWGHYLHCSPFQSEGQGAVDYIVKDFCEEGAIACAPGWRDRHYDDCVEESDCE
jgi:hypothetical protein